MSALPVFDIFKFQLLVDRPARRAKLNRGCCSRKSCGVRATAVADRFPTAGAARRCPWTVSVRQIPGRGSVTHCKVPALQCQSPLEESHLSSDADWKACPLRDRNRMVPVFAPAIESGGLCFLPPTYSKFTPSGFLIGARPGVVLSPVSPDPHIHPRKTSESQESACCQKGVPSTSGGH